MNFNKCKRCGNFYLVNSRNITSTCPICTQKDNNDIMKINRFFKENSNNTQQITVNKLSNITGISEKNITRYIKNKMCFFKIKL